jgi:Flp pilus assembly secretin CpaC
VSVSSVDDQLVLEGTVFSAAEGEDIRRLAARFVADPKELLNKMRINAVVRSQERDANGATASLR